MGHRAEGGRDGDAEGGDQLSRELIKPTEEQMRREVQRLIKSGKIPTLGELCAAVLDSRRKYVNVIRRAKRESREAK